MKIEFLRPRPSSKGLVFSIPMHYLPMSGVLLRDESGNGFTGTMTNGPVPRFPGFDFTALSSMYIDIGTGPTSIKTIALWTKPNAINVTDYPIDLNGNSLRIVNGTLTKVGFAGGTNILYTDGAVGTSLTTSWHLIGLTSTVGRNATDLDIARETNPEVFGSEKVQTPSLAVSSPPAGWTMEGDWYHENGEYIGHKETAWTGNEDTYPTMVTAVEATKTYRVTANFQALTVTNGGVTVSFGGVDKFPAQGSNSWDITATNTNGLVINIEGAGVTTDVELVSVSVKEITPASQNYYDGKIAGVRLYDSVLTPVDFINLYESTKWRYQK